MALPDTPECKGVLGGMQGKIRAILIWQEARDGNYPYFIDQSKNEIQGFHEWIGYISKNLNKSIKGAGTIQSGKKKNIS